MQINWNVRFSNPHFWVQVILAAIVPVMSYFGLSAADCTTWPMVFETLYKACTNPYICLTVLISVYNAVIDPTTAGIGDSLRALGYTKPAKEEKI